MLRLDRMKAGIIISNIFGYRLKGAFVQYSTEGNTGKSVDCEILTHLLGQENTANVSFQDMSNDRWATGRVWGKRLVVEVQAAAVDKFDRGNAAAFLWRACGANEQNAAVRFNIFKSFGRT